MSETTSDKSKSTTWQDWATPTTAVLAVLVAHGAEQMRELTEALKEGSPPERAKALDEGAAKFDETAKEKTQDKESQMKAAQRFEKSRDLMVETGFWFEISFAALQLGVILSTIAAASSSWSW